MEQVGIFWPSVVEIIPANILLLTVDVDTVWLPLVLSKFLNFSQSVLKLILSNFQAIMSSLLKWIFDQPFIVTILHWSANAKVTILGMWQEEHASILAVTQPIEW